MRGAGEPELHLNTHLFANALISMRRNPACNGILSSTVTMHCIAMLQFGALHSIGVVLSVLHR